MSVQPLAHPVPPEETRESPRPAGDPLSDALIYLAAHHGRALMSQHLRVEAVDTFYGEGGLQTRSSPFTSCRLVPRFCNFNPSPTLSAIAPDDPDLARAMRLITAHSPYTFA